MIKWEYTRLLMVYADKNAMMAEVARLGNLGWELITIDTAANAWFKRPKPIAKRRR